MTETNRIRRLYDDRAATYDRSLGLLERFALGPFRAAYGSLLRGHVLEVAIGTGLNVPFYSSAVTSAVGADLSREMLRQARLNAAGASVPIAFVQADAEALPFPDDSFDTVGISLALCTVPDPAVALRELGRVCRPHGRVILLEHVRSSAPPIAVAQRVLSPLNERAIGCHLDRDTFGLARSLGFSLEEVRGRLFGSVRLGIAKPPRSPHATLAG